MCSWCRNTQARPPRRRDQSSRGGSCCMEVDPEPRVWPLSPSKPSSPVPGSGETLTSPTGLEQPPSGPTHCSEEGEETFSAPFHPKILLWGALLHDWHQVCCSSLLGCLGLDPQKGLSPPRMEGLGETKGPHGCRPNLCQCPKIQPQRKSMVAVFLLVP